MCTFKKRISQFSNDTISCENSKWEDPFLCAGCAAVADLGAAGNTEELDKFSSCTSETVESPERLGVSAESHPGNGIFDFMDLLQNVKLTVIELVSRVSGFLQNIFPTPDAMREKMSFDADGNTKASFMDSKISMGGTFIGLAVLVIMVIVTKRA